MSEFTESVVEDAALAWLEAPGYAVRNGADVAEVPIGRCADIWSAGRESSSRD